MSIMDRLTDNEGRRYRPPTDRPEDRFLRLSARAVDYGHGLLDIAVASYDYFVLEELPRILNELRPIV